jgi:glucosamine-6-phosphate deaminase
MWTLSALQLHPHPLIVVDEDATLELQVKTVRYFKSIEMVARGEGWEQGMPGVVRLEERKAETVEEDLERAKNRSEEKKADDAKTNGSTEALVDSTASPPLAHPSPKAPTSTNLSPPVPSAQHLARSPTPELVPDNMASRLSASPAPAAALERIPTPIFDRMGGRVGAVGA